MNKPRTPKKPSGSLNVYKVTDEGVERLSGNFPTVKDDIESRIAELFIPIAKRAGFCCTGLEQNDEQDFDFTVYCNEQESFLELAELMPADQKGGGYSTSPAVDQKELADRMLSIVERKSSKYKGVKTPIDLLVYVTDDKSNISPNGEQYLKGILNQTSHVFRSIYYFVPMLQINDGILIRYYPNNVTGPQPSPTTATNLTF